ncbi:response regulator [Altererythrobacter sp. B11]|uniref:response regulator n=1 Tax=Altererythrobacter sp. B11 TaxID=2060312 RepID=UPI000DC6EE54|nr:response regulator [Altererythrobacter sp. B11]BBC73917.1 response regulator [Altererythrobacter sp. B11]
MDTPARMRILLVEDDSAVRRALQLLLTGEGYEVRSYLSGDNLERDPEALAADCLVCDLLLPQGDAIDLLGRLRAAGWDGAAILVSGHLTAEWRQRAEQAGYGAALPKPIGDRVLVNEITAQLRRRAARLPGGDGHA